MLPLNLDELVQEWLTCSYTDDRWGRLDDAPFDDPETAWRGILAILQHELTERQMSVLAAGMVENLLSENGEQFIDRVETEAIQNPRFQYLLGGVRRCGMVERVWARVQKARKEVWQ